MIDVVVLERKNNSFLRQCISSIEREPVNLYVLPASSCVGDGRIKGFYTGHSPYVCFIDDDDVVIPGIFHKAQSEILKGAYTYYSNHYVVDENLNIFGRRFDRLAPSGLLQDIQMHHVVVYKRSIINDYIGYLRGVVTRDKRILNYASILEGNVSGDLTEGLFWRIHSGNNHKNSDINKNPREWFETVKSLELQIIEKSRD